jgi:succinate dehydrogenase / fumarate reductase iron-sulfur subunit
MFDFIFKRETPEAIKNGDKAIVRIQRFNPEVDEKPHMEEYEVPMTSETTVLDALHHIKTEQDGSLTFRRSCRHAICGSCAMNINGSNDLACHRPLNESLDHHGKITIKPLPFQPIIKDLVVDRTTFWAQYMKIKPWLIPPDNIPEKEFRMSPAEVDALHNAETCIMCGACYSSCQVVGMSKEYIGPHALLKSFLRTGDPRDSIPGERLEIVDGDNGVYRCHTIFNCIDACPKGLNPTEAIETLRKLAQKRLAFEEARAERQKTLNEPIREK